MNEQTEDLCELVKKHIQTIEPNAEVILLFPHGKSRDEEIQIYILAPEEVDFELEQQYLKAKYQVELTSMQNLSVYIYFKEKWHKQLVGTPIYNQVTNEGILL